MSSGARVYTAAVIGVGRAGSGGAKGGGHQIGYTHAAMYRRAGRVDLAAAADISEENLAAFQEKFAARRAFSDYRQMLEQVRPAVVSICTYVGLHREMIEACASAGVKAVICEKPFVASPADLTAVRALAERSGLRIALCHIRRYLPAMQRAVELFHGGAVGRPTLCFASLDGWDLSEMGSHWFDLFRFFNGDAAPLWVMGQARVTNQRGFGHAMEDHAVAVFEFANGCRGVLEAGRPHPGGFNILLAGSDGTIRILEENTLSVDSCDGRRVESFADHPGSGWEAMWDHLLQDVLSWLDTGREPMTGLGNISLSVELNLGAYISAVRGDRVDLPLQDNTSEWPVEILARRAGG